jgi:HSP20 family molecular chaperone IbpA
MLSAFNPFPLATRSPLWADPFADIFSPFSLMPSFDDFPPMPTARVEVGDAKALKVIFDELDGYDKVDVSVDEQTNVVTIKAEDSAGTKHATRMITLPCAVQNCGKITAEHVGSQVVVTVSAP